VGVRVQHQAPARVGLGRKGSETRIEGGGREVRVSNV
jgi:hypothetical protein